MSLTFILAATLAQPTPLKIFGDWIAGCDNGRACEARALSPQGQESGWSIMELARGPAANAAVRLRIVDVEGAGRVRVAAGARAFEAQVGKDGVLEIPAASTTAMLAAARTDTALQLSAGGRDLGRVSLKGASAALLWIDEQQKRLGTITALSRPGPRPASAVPPAPPLPIVAVPAPQRLGPPVRLTAAALREVMGDSGCKPGDHRTDEPPSYERLDARHTLALAPLVCVSGAYNMEVDAHVITDGRPGDPDPAEYEKIAADAEDGGDITDENTTWDPRRRRLSVSMKGRSFGDCGSRREYAWDGRRFRFVFEEDMGECRGATAYIPTWRAVVVER